MTVGEGREGNEKESRNSHNPTQFLSLTIPGFSYYLSQHLPAMGAESKGALHTLHWGAREREWLLGLGEGRKNVAIENTNEQLQRKNSEFSTSIPRI